MPAREAPSKGAFSFSTGGSGGEDRLTENVSLNFQTVPLEFDLPASAGNRI